MIDLAIEFSTLGEYGLEYPDESTAGPCRRGMSGCRPSARDERAAAGRRSRTRALRGSHRRLRDGNSGNARTRPGTTAQSGRPVVSSSLPEALRPPRIKLSFN